MPTPIRIRVPRRWGVVLAAGLITSMALPIVAAAAPEGGEGRLGDRAGMGGVWAGGGGGGGQGSGRRGGCGGEGEERWGAKRKTGG